MTECDLDPDQLYTHDTSPAPPNMYTPLEAVAMEADARTKGGTVYGKQK